MKTPESVRGGTLEIDHFCELDTAEYISIEFWKKNKVEASKRFHI